ncbi:MAG: S8 family serine peptidase [Planctomycetes bacterium]|nr:S8 family serine peptidase [Planctomycetota bacterium]
MAGTPAHPAGSFQYVRRAVPPYMRPLDGPGSVTPRVLVRFDPLADRASQEQLAATGVQWVEREISLVPGLFVVQVAPGEEALVAERLRALPGVLYAEADGDCRALAQTIPYGVTMVHAPQHWTKYGSGSGPKGPVRVAVLDTGIDQAHPDLPAPLLTKSFVVGETIDDVYQHGSHVSGTIAAVNNSEGVVGVAPQISLLAGKVLDNSGFGQWSDTAAGIDWAVASGARVINMSLGGTSQSQAVHDSCDAALAAGVLVVAAGGNDGDDTVIYPGGYPSVMAVAAVDQNRAHASFSNTGAHISVAAPGVEVLSTVPELGLKATWGGKQHAADLIANTPYHDYTSPAYDCGDGLTFLDFPDQVAFNIAHIQRSFWMQFLGVSYFIENAWDAGAYAVIISNNTSGSWQADMGYLTFRPGITISQADGADLIAHDGATVAIALTANGHGYEAWDGTSMATPHVSASAALLFGAFVPEAGLPPLPPATVRWVLERTADNPGTPPRNNQFGYGIINAEKAGDYLAGRIRCAGDLNSDGVVDDADFSIFLGFYNAYLSPGGKYTGADFNGDGVADDQDFQRFVVRYDDLLCP